VVVGAGAKVLGPFKVGDNSKIGSNSVVIKEVPANSTVVGVPGRVVYANGTRNVERQDLEHGQLPDPAAQALHCLFDRLNALETRVQELTGEGSGNEQAAEVSPQGRD